MVSVCVQGSADSMGINNGLKWHGGQTRTSSWQTVRAGRISASRSGECPLPQWLSPKLLLCPSAVNGEKGVGDIDFKNSFLPAWLAWKGPDSKLAESPGEWPLINASTHHLYPIHVYFVSRVRKRGCWVVGKEPEKNTDLEHRTMGCHLGKMWWAHWADKHAFVHPTMDFRLVYLLSHKVIKTKHVFFESEGTRLEIWIFFCVLI